MRKAESRSAHQRKPRRTKTPVRRRWIWSHERQSSHLKITSARLLLVSVLVLVSVLLTASGRLDQSTSASGVSPITGAQRLFEGRDQFGVFLIDENAGVARLAADTKLPSNHVVLLVHGLDEPGGLWVDLAPELQDAGHTVCEVRYPNDAGIAESAGRMIRYLTDLRRRGVTSVDVVAHSMGGLVTRDVLTRDVGYAGDARGNADGESRLPAIRHFIMCGTPNHGSEWARLRSVAEVREHVLKLWRSEGDLHGMQLDGDGQAGPDLVPGSTFLTDLNSRPLPEHVEISIIRAHMTPAEAQEFAGVFDSIAKQTDSLFGSGTSVAAWIRTVRDTTGVATVVATESLGDGVVTMQSALLDGVSDVTTIEANHRSMLKNLLPGRSEAAPAIPLILERLAPESPAAPAASDSAPPEEPDGEPGG